MSGGGETALAEWLEARLVDVDAALASRVRDAVGAVGAAATLRDGAEALLRAATARLEPLAAAGCIARESAIELLAVDTLVTLACEAMADAHEDPATIVDGATTMVRTLAATMPSLGGAE
jgi:hypothetical protein